MSSRHFYAFPEAPAAVQQERPGAFSKWPAEVAGSRPERESGVRSWAAFQSSQPEGVRKAHLRFRDLLLCCKMSLWGGGGGHVVSGTGLAAGSVRGRAYGVS